MGGCNLLSNRLLLFHNDGHGKMTDVSQMQRRCVSWKYAARGLAVGDLNNDGYPDVVVGINGGPPLILYNNAESKNHWIGLRLVGSEANHYDIGATTQVERRRSRYDSRLKTAGGSFLSSHDPREVIGLGKAGQARLGRDSLACSEYQSRSFQYSPVGPIRDLDRG